MSNPYQAGIVLNTRENKLDDSTLIQRSRIGNEGAFRELIKRYSPGICSTVARMLGKGIEATEVSHDVFLRFYKALDTVDDDTNVPAYLHRIAVNLSLNELKRKKKWYQRFTSIDSMLPTSEPKVDQAPKAETNECMRVIEDAIQRLPPKLRAVAVLRLVQEFSTKETAEILDIPVGTVLSRLSRAQTKLRTQLAPYIEE